MSPAEPHRIQSGLCRKWKVTASCFCFLLHICSLLLPATFFISVPHDFTLHVALSSMVPKSDPIFISPSIFEAQPLLTTFFKFCSCEFHWLILGLEFKYDTVNCDQDAGPPGPTLQKIAEGGNSNKGGTRHTKIQSSSRANANIQISQLYI